VQGYYLVGLQTRIKLRLIELVERFNADSLSYLSLISTI
jgi:hypothetical protein